MVAVCLVMAALGIAAIKLDAPRMAIVAVIAAGITYVCALAGGQSFIEAALTMALGVAAFQVGYIFGIVIAAASRKEEPRLVTQR